MSLASLHGGSRGLLSIPTTAQPHQIDIENLDDRWDFSS
jgi:hypothetical protein